MQIKSSLRTFLFFLKYLLNSFLINPQIHPPQFSWVTQLCPTLCYPMNRSTPGLPVHHQLPEFTQTHMHRVSDDIQPSHSLSSPSPPAPNPSQHQGLFQWVNSSHEVAKVLEFQSPMNTQDWSPLGWTGWISKGLARVFSSTTVQKHQFFSAQLSSQSLSHPYMTTGKSIPRQTMIQLLSLYVSFLDTSTK